MQAIKDKLIVALDVDSLDKAKKLVNLLYPTIKLFKVGSSLAVCSESLIQYISGKGGRIFLDFKWYDIPNTVYCAVGTSTASGALSAATVLTNEASGTERKVMPGVFMMTVHTQGGKEMLEAAVKGATEKAKEKNIAQPFIVGVTVLTSDSGGQNVQKDVLERAMLAKNAGLDGVVCSVNEAAAVKKECGRDFIVVTPGIRPSGAALNDQARSATPKAAVDAGADFLVVGRPIIEAKDPLGAAKNILKEIGN